MNKHITQYPMLLLGIMSLLFLWNCSSVGVEKKIDISVKQSIVQDETARREVQNYWKNKNDELNVGLALGAGAAKGLAHIGVLKALEEANIEIDFMAGSSMGALVGGAYATGMTVDSAIVITQKTELKDLFQYIDLGIPTTGFIPGDKISAFLLELYGKKKFEELSIPFAVTATDIYSGKGYVISKGDVATAVRTSISIPVVFETVTYKDILLVDGGLTDPVPIDITRKMGADFIIAVNVLARPIHDKPYTNYISADSIKTKEKTIFSFSFKGTGAPKRNLMNERGDLIRIIQNTVSISQARIAEFQVQLGQPDLLIEPDMTSIHAWEFYKGQIAIEIGYKTAWQALYKYHQEVIRMDQVE